MKKRIVMLMLCCAVGMSGCTSSNVEPLPVVSPTPIVEPKDEEPKKERSFESQLYLDLVRYNFDYNNLSTIEYGLKLNDNQGTPEDGDYVLLINATYESGPKTGKDIISMASLALASGIEQNYSEITEMTIFWSCPNCSGDCKITYTRKTNGNMVKSDEFWGF